MTTQNLVDLSLTDTALANVHAALTIVETELGGLVALSAAQKRSMRKMGEKSESFSRQALQVVAQNPQMIPPNIPISAAQADLKLLDQLRPVFARIARLNARGNDTDAALGNDILSVALQAYGLLKLTGRAEGMEALRRDLSGLFARSKSANRGGKPAGVEGSLPAPVTA